MRTFDEAAGKVRALLFDGTLRPGDRLPAERELSALLGISRPALREALRALETGGLLEIRPGKNGGTFITAGRASVVSGAMSDLLRLGSVSIAELFEARQWIQGALVRAACERLTDEQIDALEHNVDEAEAAHAQGRFADRIRLNVEFHNMLAAGAGNAVATIVVRGLTQAWEALIAEVGSDQVSGGVRYRRELLGALRARDEDGAARALSKILRTSEALYKDLAKRRAQALLASAAAPASRASQARKTLRAAPRKTAAAAARRKVAGTKPATSRRRPAR